MYWVIDAIPGRLDPGHHQGRNFTLSPSQWLTAHPAIDNLPWALSLSHIATQTYQHVTEVTDYFGEAQSCSSVRSSTSSQWAAFCWQ